MIKERVDFSFTLSFCNYYKKDYCLTIIKSDFFKDKLTNYLYEELYNIFQELNSALLRK